LVLDLSPEQAVHLKEQANVTLSPRAALNRRVYFLAVNHRNPKLQSAAVRRALAYAINREQLLDEHFRKGLGAVYHQALNGPYPARSWALNPALAKREGSLDPFDAELARGLLSQEAKDLPQQIELTLKYPADDKILAEALGQVEQDTKGEPNPKTLAG